jgi:diaminohydroxyphosphoribosylaminopyrimidine deaminase / 5-amino-6-(5-phosphoribosylamino)uracil reductase
LIYRNKTLRAVLKDLGRKQVTSVLIEGGGEVLGAAFDARLVDKVQFYLAPLFTGGPVMAVAGKGAGETSEGGRLTRIRYDRIGPDLRVTGYPRWDAEKGE